MKKFLSLLLAVVMVFTLGVGALADDGAEESGSTSTDNSSTIESVTTGSNSASHSVTGYYTPEALWGTSAESLTSGGTLADAIAAAEAEGSTVTYIQLQKDITTTEGYKFEGTYTLDLNGHSVCRASGTTLFVYSYHVTITDSSTAKTGAVTGGGEGYAVSVNFGGELTIEGGSYTGDRAVNIANDSANKVTINGGSFTTTGIYTIGKEAGTLVINGGTFTAGTGGTVVAVGTTTINGGTFTGSGSYGHIRYFSGTLDLSGYSATSGGTALTELTVYNGSADSVTVGTDVKLPNGYGFYERGDTGETIVSALSSSTRYAIKSTSGGTTTDTATITGVTIKVDGETYTNSNTTADAPAVITSASTVTVTVGGTNLNSAGDQNLLTWDGSTYLVKSTEWTINDEGTTSTRTCAAAMFSNFETAGQIQYSNDGGQNWTDTGVYIIYGYTVTIATAAEAHGTVTADKTKVKEGDKVTLTVTPDTGYGIDTISVKQGDDDVDVTQEMGGAIYFTMPKGDVTVTVTFKELAKITGISVTVGNQTYTSGQTVSLNAATGQVTITVSGTNFDALTSNNKFALLVNDQTQSSSSLNGEGWTVDKENNTATTTVESSDFANYSSAVQLAYSNDGTTWEKSGVYLTYQELISVSITWDDMSFTYDDTQTDEGDDKGWTGDGNTITVKNESSISVSPSVTYAPASGYTDITGTITPATNANALNKGDSMTYTLTLSGKPKASIEAGTTVGTVTVTIAQAQ